MPPEPVDLLLRRFREHDGAVRVPIAPEPRPVEQVVASHPSPPDVAPHADPEWTFRPDEAPAPTWPYAGYDPAHHEGQAPRRRVGLAPRVGVLVIACALITGALALSHIGPFHSAPRAAATPTTSGSPTDIRGVWNALNAYSGVLYVATMHITTENLSTGAFSGTITSPVGVETMQGTVVATALTFTINLGNSSERVSGVVSHIRTKAHIQAVFSNPGGGHGTIVATRTSR